MVVMAGSRYIEIPAPALLSELRSIAEAVKAKGGKVEELLHGREVVFEVAPPGSMACVRIYTSLAAGAGSVRDCGEDAVRLVLGARVTIDGEAIFKPLGGSRRIYRTAPKGAAEDRVTAFLGRLREAIREGYKAALHVPTCPACKAPMTMRNSRNGSFMGCVRYPSCRGTRPIPIPGLP